jgi:hypothetical protein
MSSGIWQCIAPVEITEIAATTEKGVWALVKKTGRLAWFPKSQTQFRPGLAIVPEWLAQKLCPAPENN